jgi:hypothetical protein
MVLNDQKVVAELVVLLHSMEMTPLVVFLRPKSTSPSLLFSPMLPESPQMKMMVTMLPV